jgi:hypothetical protein
MMDRGTPSPAHSYASVKGSLERERGNQIEGGQIVRKRARDAEGFLMIRDANSMIWYGYGVCNVLTFWRRLRIAWMALTRWRDG